MCESDEKTGTFLRIMTKDWYFHALVIQTKQVRGASSDGRALA